MTQASALRVTVCICTRDRPALLDQCLAALSKQTYTPFDVLVVDSASAVPVHEICRRWNAACLPATAPGLTIARNIGAREAQGDIIAYIDDDAVAEPDWLETLVQDFQDPEVAAVTGRIRYMKGLGDSRLMTEEEAVGYPTRERRAFDRATPGWFALACFGGIGDGGNMAFRRKLIASAQQFDERIGCGRLVDGGDEHALFALMIANGCRITHNPAAIVRHPSPPTPELQRQRKYRDVRSSIALLFFTWFEFAAFRKEILRFVRRALIKRLLIKRQLSSADLPQQSVRLSPGKTLLAMLSGTLIYWRARRQWTADGGLGPRAPAISLPEDSDRRKPLARSSYRPSNLQSRL